MKPSPPILMLADEQVTRVARRMCELQGKEPIFELALQANHLRQFLAMVHALSEIEDELK